MFAFENVRFVKNTEISATTLNEVLEAIPYGKFFTRRTSSATLIIRGPETLERWLKSRRNYNKLSRWGRGPNMGPSKQKLFGGLYWRDEQDSHKLYVMFDGRTIPWKNWVSWCKKNQKKSVKA
jgi:hypothetical protein